MPRQCDNTSVGVIIRNPEGEFALLHRANFPAGIAPAAGHIDDHGSPEQAALNETREELGLVIASSELVRTIIQGRTVDSECRRPCGDHHRWWIYEAQSSDPLIPSKEETKGAAWYDSVALQALADRTKAYRTGRITPPAWAANPGLGEVWLDFFTELGHVR